MGNFIYSLSPQNYTISASTNINASYPASNIEILNRPKLYTRTTSTTAPVITIDLTGAASDVTIQAFTIQNVNFGSLLVEGATNAAPTTWSYSQTVTPTATDDEDGRRKLYFTPTSTFTRRYVRLTPSSLDSGASFYYIGSFAAWPSITTLSKNFGRPHEKQLEDDAEEVGTQIGDPSYMRVRFSLQARTSLTDTTAMAQYYSLANIPRDRVIMLYENEGTTTKVYHCQRETSMRYTRQGDGMMQFSSIQFREV